MDMIATTCDFKRDDGTSNIHTYNTPIVETNYTIVMLVQMIKLAIFQFAMLVRMKLLVDSTHDVGTLSTSYCLSITQNRSRNPYVKNKMDKNFL